MKVYANKFLLTFMFLPRIDKKIWLNARGSFLFIYTRWKKAFADGHAAKKRMLPILLTHALFILYIDEWWTHNGYYFAIWTVTSRARPRIVTLKSLGRLIIFCESLIVVPLDIILDTINKNLLQGLIVYKTQSHRSPINFLANQLFKCFPR